MKDSTKRPVGRPPMPCEKISSSVRGKNKQEKMEKKCMERSKKHYKNYRCALIDDRCMPFDKVYDNKAYNSSTKPKSSMKLATNPLYATSPSTVSPSPVKSLKMMKTNPLYSASTTTKSASTNTSMKSSASTTKSASTNTSMKSSASPSLMSPIVKNKGVDKRPPGRPPMPCEKIKLTTRRKTQGKIQEQVEKKCEARSKKAYDKYKCALVDGKCMTITRMKTNPLFNK